jgi:hypothetical protein
MRISFVAWLSLVLLAVSVRANAASPHTAQVSDVPDAAEPDNSFDFNASVGFRRVVRQARLTREGVSGSQATFADELSYTQITQVLDMRAQVSLFHDFALDFYLPYTFNQDAQYTYRSGVSETNSTVFNDPTLGGQLFPVPYRTFKRGLTAMDFGLSFSPFNDQRDETQPTLTLRVAYSYPIGPAFNPQRSSNAAEDAAIKDGAQNGVDSRNPAPLGDRVHRLKFEVDFSKRFGPVEPYVTAHYVQPFVATGAATGIQPALTGGFQSGFEIIAWDVPTQRKRLTFDLRAGLHYVGSGRTYSELTDAFRQLTWVDNYATLTGGLHVVLQPIQYLRLSAGATLGHDTQHLITNENPGLPGTTGEVDLNDPTQRNPFYRPEIDTPGRRFRVEDTSIFAFYVALQLML